MITRTDVAKRAGVSVGTVSNVMNNKESVKPEYVKRVKKAIEELNYIPDFTAKSLAKRKSNHIGVAVYEMTNPYHAEIIEGLEEYAAGKGYMVTTFLLDNKLNKKLDAICERRLDALVNFMTNALPDNFISALESQNTVLVNFSEENSFIVVNDYEKAMMSYMQLLSSLEHKYVAYVSTVDKMRFEVDSRGKTFLSKRAEMGFSEDDSFILCNNDYSLRSERIGYMLADKLIGTHSETTAVFATNDLCAIGLMKRFAELGLHCPEDVSVIGCDNISIGEYFIPGLCTIGFDKKAYGRAIAKAIIDEIDSGYQMPYRTLRFEAISVLRDSVDKARG